MYAKTTEIFFIHHILYSKTYRHCFIQQADARDSLCQNYINPLPLSSHSMVSPDPELPDTTLFVTVFPRNFQADISALQE